MSQEKEESPYKTCFLYSTKQCGLYQRFKKPVDAMFGVEEELTSNVKSHFIVLKIMRSNGNIDEWNERKLIENRLKTVIPEKK